MYQYAYLVGDGILAIVWLILFFLRKDLRRQQLFMSLLFAPLGPLTQYLWFYQDYWRPQYIISFKTGQVPLGFEEVLFGFFFCGIAAVIYEAIFKKRHSFGKPRTLAALVIFTSGIVLMGILRSLGFGSIWASILAIFIGSIVMMLIDKDIIKDAIWTGLLMIALMICHHLVWQTIYPEAVQKLWITSSLSGIRIWKIPIEELLWYAGAGTVAGILYEFWLNVKRYPDR